VIINLLYDSQALAAPQSFRNGMQAAANLLQAAFDNNITVNVAVGYGEYPAFNGQSSQTLPNQNTSEGGPWGSNLSYTALRQDLINTASSADDNTSTASLPSGSSLQGHSSFFVANAQLKAFGVSTSGAADGGVGMGTNFTGNVLIAGALHEITHVMGRIAGSAMDVFRYSSVGNHVFGGNIPAPASYFSINGGSTDLADFGVNSDPGDFNNSTGRTPNDPFNEIVGNLASLTAVDLTIMDVLGFHRVGLADLVASNLVLVGTTATYGISNIGSGTAGASTTGIYLSADSTVTTADTLIATTSTPSLAAGASDGEGLSLPLPGNLTPGTYYIGAVADSGAQVAEANEQNNVSNVIAIILGNSSANVLSGTSANDAIFGLGGADTLNGGAGGDMLIGGPGSDRFVFDAAALADAQAAATVFDRITDYDQGNSGVFSAAEGDQIDLSALLSTAYNHGSGQPVAALVRVIASGARATLQIDIDGTANAGNWLPVARLDGIDAGNSVNVILDASQPAGTNVTVLAGYPPNDFDSDHNSDVQWRTGSGALAIWEMNGTQIKAADYFKIGQTTVGAPGADWHIVGTDALPADFDGDGKGDLLWWTDSGALAIWEMNGTQIKAADYLRQGQTIVGTPNTSWHVLDTADFDGDGKSDLLWRTDSGALAIWEMNGTQIKAADYLKSGQTVVGASGPDWHILGTADFDGDGKGDLLWRTDSGTLAIWEMNGTQIKAADYLRQGQTIVGAPNTSWHIVGTGDFDGDGKTDLLWRTDGGTLAIWEMNGTQIKAADYLKAGQTIVGAPGPDWHIAGTGDFNGDGKTDLLWRTDSGALAIWEMNGTQINAADYLRTGQASVGAPGADWTIVQHHYDLL
jgi:hypothetical protein